MARMSEEQWNDLKFKITVGVILLIVGSAAYSIGPGLKKFVARARAHKTELAWAPKWYYNLGRIYEATWRKPEAEEVYKEFYHNYSGDEKLLQGIATVIEDTKYPQQDIIAFIPKWGGPGRPTWVGGEGAKPHPLLADVLMRLSRMEEEQRNYQDSRLYYRMVLDNPDVFAPGTPAHVAAEAAKKRDISRGF